MFQNKEIRETIIIIFCVILIFINIIHIYLTGCAEGYEISIYTAYPVTVWIIFIFVDVLILYVVIIYNNKLTKIISLLLFWLNQLIVLILPLFRGYYIYGRFDVLVHLGHVKDILFSGHISNNNFYPIMHILIVELYFITEIPINVMTIVLPALFWSMFLLWYFVFIKTYIGTDIAKLSLIAWMLFPLGYWHTSMVGNLFSYYLMFLALGIWRLNLPKAKKSLIFILICITLIYFHPLTSIYFIVILIIFEMLNKIILEKNNYDNNLFNTLLIVLSIWIMWYFTFPNIQRDFELFLLSLFNPTGNPFFNRYTLVAKKFNLPIFRLVEFIVYRYFGVLIFSTGAIIFLVLQIRYKLAKKYTSKLIPFIFMFILFLLWSVANVFLRFVNFERSLRYVLAFALPLGSLLFFYKFPKCKLRIVFIIFIIILSYFAIFTVHRSPLSGQANNQVSASEYNGMKWWFKNKDRTLLGYDDGMISQWRFYAAMFGVEKAKKCSGILYFTRSRIPEHFGYSKSTNLCNIFSKQTYLIIGRAILESYKATIPENIKKWRWTPWDLERLKLDLNVGCIYTSRDLSIYFITCQ